MMIHLGELSEGKLRDFEYYCGIKVYKGETALTNYMEDSQTQQVR